MIKRTAASLALLLALAACATTPMGSNGTESGGGLLGSNGVTTAVNDAPEYILLEYPNQVRNVDYSRRISGLHIRGTVTNRGFFPAGNIQGNGQFCENGNDFFSLATLSVIKASDGKTPVAPYIKGCATARGFQPASRDIVLQ